MFAIVNHPRSMLYKDTKYVMCFLKGLGDAYNNVKSQNSMMDPLPNINRAFSLVMQQERQLAGNILNKV